MLTFPCFIKYRVSQLHGLFLSLRPKSTPAKTLFANESYHNLRPFEENNFRKRRELKKVYWIRKRKITRDEIIYSGLSSYTVNWRGNYWLPNWQKCCLDVLPVLYNRHAVIYNNLTTIKYLEYTARIEPWPPEYRSGVPPIETTRPATKPFPGFPHDFSFCCTRGPQFELLASHAKAAATARWYVGVSRREVTSLLVLVRLPADVNSSTCYDLSANATATASDKRDDATGMSVLLAKSACPSVRPYSRMLQAWWILITSKMKFMPSEANSAAYFLNDYINP